MNFNSSAIPAWLLLLRPLLVLITSCCNNAVTTCSAFTAILNTKPHHHQKPATTSAAVSPSSIVLRAASTSASTSASASTEALEKTKDGVYICTEMPPPLPANLKNTYYLLRHGQSWGNVEGVISSARSLATSEKHGLTPLGYEQGRNSSGQLLQLIDGARSRSSAGASETKRRLFFYSSPFARARQTAQACLEGLVKDSDSRVSDDTDTDTGVSIDNKKKKKNTVMIKELNLDVQEEIIIEDGLMERFFGRLDDEAIHTYAYVWPVDMFDPCHVAFEVESVAAVCTRLRETILKIEESDIHQEGEGDIIVMTSHADVLQICQLYACGAENVGMFSGYRFTNGEVREMGRSVDTLPEPQPLQPPKRGT